jgi:hypothetical protein
MTSIALCGIVKDEVRSIVEWLAHYKALGFTDFVIYDNESTDGTEKILQVLDEAGELIHLEWPHAMGERPQRAAYDHMRRNRYRAAPVIERFTESLEPGAPYNRSMKGIARRERLAGIGIHRQDISEGRYVTPTGRDAQFVTGQIMRRHEPKVAVLHHYMVKSMEEYEEKRHRGHANSQDPGKKRGKLDLRFHEFNAPGVPNTDMLACAGRMRAEALRLREILLAAGVSFPVWPFVEAEAD